MPNSVAIGRSSTAPNNSIAIGSTPLIGGNITFSPGKGSTGGGDGAVIWASANGSELMRLSEDGISLFGQLIPLQKILDLLTQIQEKHLCNCSTQQILNIGCVCGGK